jgi:phosphoribosylformimino-5-aminoimidazole carboxamide ribonucleotide (ProFAR) isomerase|tara:strand:- start:17 stop:229 length:213 start_codon:yes stop_codon:yes gene_type:complete
LTHGKIQDESLRESLGIHGNPIGKIIYHDLNRDGVITYYDIKFGNQVCESIPANLIESVNEQQHEHEERS